MLAALLVAARDGIAQQSAPVAPMPTVEAPRKSDSPSVDAPKASKEEVDAQLAAMIERVFGKGSAAARRPVRLWLPQVGMAITAKEATLGPNGSSVRFVELSLGLPREAKILHGTDGVIVVDRPVTETGQLVDRRVVSVEFKTKLAASH